MNMKMTSSREVRLAAHPTGTLLPEHFVITEAVPVPGANDVVVRNRWFRVSVSTRLMATHGAEAVKGIPFPVLKPGDVLADGAIGEVVSCPHDSGFRVGDLIYHPLGWREYAAVDASQCVALGNEPIDPAAYLGHGWTAYAALTRGIQIREGDTVFVSSGAGAIGSMAGQIARKLGAGRVIGSTGTKDKAEWMKAELGYDTVIMRNGRPIIEPLAEAAPDGIDVFVDMVGGEQLSAAMACAREGARFVLLGALTAELNVSEASLRAPLEIDSFQLIIKGITLRGYSADSDATEAFAEWLQCARRWQSEGDFHLTHTTFHGIDSAPRALHEACAGKLRGVVMVAL
ncbi:NADP-dependent oxidoreductase [Dyella sp. ASV21]|uniref:MDR family NADP-dependent oxidoreductase n=1 Tax=Dyella sp. ASV21 TaxID=2795114 RepID=UPI0018ECE295|nr:NADP-dependent oxidoreductase [Dyella sp. ASV21]